MVWALRGALTRMWLFLPSLSRSVTTRGRSASQLLQIETEDWLPLKDLDL